MQICYPYIVRKNFPKFYENPASSFWDMRQSMCIIVVVEYHYGGGSAQTNHYSFGKKKKS